jgi:uncharacterized protein YndB with AHSA1/START domain
MSTNTRVLPVPRAAVWAALQDGFAYSYWVVGTSRIRNVDPTWPERGSRLHYRIGRGPIRHDGHTEVCEVEDGTRLVLEAHAWPLGTAQIDIRLEDVAGPESGAGCRVTLEEHPARGIAALVHNPIGDGVLHLRNVESLRRLERLAQEKHAGMTSAPAR